MAQVSIVINVQWRLNQFGLSRNTKGWNTQQIQNMLASFVARGVWILTKSSYMRGGTRIPSSNAALARRRLKPKKIWLHTKGTTQGKGHSNVRSVELDLHATVDSGSIKREFTRLHQEEVKQDGQSLGRQMSPLPKLNRYEDLCLKRW